jgi:hypothetical protein
MPGLTWRASGGCPVSPYTVADLAGATDTSRLRATVMTLYATQAELEEARGLLAQLKGTFPDAAPAPDGHQLAFDFSFD